MKNIVLLASGGGSSVENILRFFIDDKKVIISNIFCNNPKAGLLQRPFLKNYKLSLISNSQLNNGIFLKELLKIDPELIVLAGFLQKIPKKIVEKFPDKIINIHPSLLPKYGGKGMYGLNVHREVIKNNEKKSGFTIHYVNDHYDKGSIIFQKSIPVETFNALELSKKILTQEHKYYPQIIKKVLNV
jgi:phosphoribosylglycinamide formyltransferase-1